MLRIKNIFAKLFVLALVAIPLSLNAQQENNNENKENMKKAEQTQTMEQNINTDKKEFSAEDFKRKLASLDEEPGDNLEKEFQSIANEHAMMISIDEDAREDIKEAIVEYLDSRWETEVELAKLRDNSEEHKEHATSLAYLRVDLAESIKDNLDENASQYNSKATDFWSSLDWDIFNLQMQKTGIASGNTNTNLNY